MDMLQEAPRVSPLESPLTTAAAAAAVAAVAGGASSSVELLEECERASSAARDCSMLSRLLEEGSWRYFSGT